VSRKIIGSEGRGEAPQGRRASEKTQEGITILQGKEAPVEKSRGTLAVKMGQFLNRSHAQMR